MELLTFCLVAHTLCSNVMFSASFSKRGSGVGSAWPHPCWRHSLRIHLQMSYTDPLAPGKESVPRLLSTAWWSEVKISYLISHMCELQMRVNLLNPSCWHTRGAELPAQGVNSLTHPFSFLSALFWKCSNTSALYNLSSLSLFHLTPQIPSSEQGISVSPRPSLFQDLPHPFVLTQPIARVAIWSQLCAPCQSFLPKMKKITQPNHYVW